ncbi:phosphate transporter [Stanieria cyanosphaera PCC 7437]|uniref:Phosphate transporter n=1 Tax=Stanieria cyanosphaera (strain ATCC 29371 / PCC 7437) TaxID=111780 RepID=K9Y002_STAC7|nr:inorganic phosphate transporter [Stanieria cyanosphaera]AFZ37716.1 phosphate transporter [Stanieria cyanosphaera PCC 7437]
MSLGIIFQLSLVAILAFYVAWNLGANDVANSMGTSVGSKAISLKQALIIAGILEFTGAIIFGHEVSATLATKIANPDLFSDQPQLFVLGMVSVLIACGLWLQIATSKGLPVASSHAVVGAIAGFSWVAVGQNAVDWSNIGFICLGWLVTPIISAIIAAFFYNLLQNYLLNTSDSLTRLQEWIPWLSSSLVAIFSVIVLPRIWQENIFQSFPLPLHDLSLLVGGTGAISISWFSWQQLEKAKQSHTEKRAALEKIMAKFQVFSACFVAFAHGSNDVGNAIAPLAAIVYVFNYNTVPINGINIPAWILILGGLGIVAGLAVQGKNVITTIGEDIITLVPSSGFCAELATATTILLASRIGLPVSTSHALVGSVVGIGILQKTQKVQWQTIKSVILAWVITLPAAAILGIISFSLLRLITLTNYQ